MQQVDLLIFGGAVGMSWHYQSCFMPLFAIRRLNFRIRWLPSTQNCSLGRNTLTLPSVTYKVLYSECPHLSQFRLLSIHSLEFFFKSVPVFLHPALDSRWWCLYHAGSGVHTTLNLLVLFFLFFCLFSMLYYVKSNPRFKNRKTKQAPSP